MKKVESILLMAAFLIALLCGCRASPEKESVTSKNDGSFDANSAISATEHHSIDATKNITYKDSFSSADGTVEFLFDFNETVTDADMPIVKVLPHMLKGEDVKRVTEAIFGEGNFFELDSFVEPILSKAEIQEKLSRWAQYSSNSALNELYGDDNYNADLVQRFIARYTEEYEMAPDDIAHQETKWQFQNGSRYYLTEQDKKQMDVSDFNDEIVLKNSRNNVDYLLIAATRNKQTSKLNSISVAPYGGLSPDDIDTRIFYSRLCRTGKPSEEQVENAQELAKSILQQMNLGEWKIDQCYVSSSFYQHEDEYVINVDAVPSFNGVAAARQDQFAGLSSDESSYAFNYYLTNAHFEFSADGKIVEFELDSPIDMEEVVNDNVAAIDFDTLLQQAKDHLRLSDYYEYGFGSMIDDVKREEDLICRVTINQLDYNLLRVKVPNSFDSYYYVPGLVLSGTTEYYGKNSGTLYYTYRNTDNENQYSRTLLVLNAVDGTIVR